MPRGLAGGLDAVTPSTSHLLSAGSAMPFETSQSTSASSNRRAQQRTLSFLVMIAMLVLIVNVIFTDPAKKPDATARRTRTPPRDNDFSVDFNVRNEEERASKSDEVLIVPADGTLPERFELPTERSREWLDEQAERGEEWAADAAARARAEARRNTRFNKRVLSSVRDNTVGIRRGESDAYYRLLGHVQQVAPDELELASTTETQYLNLMTEPDRFRGEPLTIQGDLWRLYEFDAGPNDLGLTTLYEAWIFTGDSQPHPYRVVCTRLPHTLTPGEDIRRPVRVTGYFFKREAYPSRGGFHVAPTLIANTLAPFRLADSIPPTDAILPYMVGVVTAMGLALLVTLLAFTLGDRRIKRLARQRTLGASSPSFAGVDHRSLGSVEESLSQFAELQRQADLRDEIVATGRNAGSVATSVLYRRDPYASVPPPVPASLSEDELHSRQLSQATTLQSWTARQRTADKISRDTAVNDAALLREQSDTEHVLDTLDPEQAADDDESDRGDASDERRPRNRSDSSVFTLSQARSSQATELDESANSGTVNNHDAIRAGASKLAEWEREVEQFSSRTDTTSTATTRASAATRETVDSSRTTASTSIVSSDTRERIARVEVERDRLTREQELRERLQRQQSELEIERQEQLERDREAQSHSEWNDSRAAADRERARLEQDRSRLESERLERERIERERFERDRVDRERLLLEEQDRQQLELRRLERLHREREREAQDRDALLRAERDGSREAAERERVRLETERVRLNSERLERERIERERLLAERLLREKLERDKRELERKERLATERTEYRSVRREVSSLDEVASEEVVGDELSLDESSLTEEQREERRRGGNHRGGWGWPRRGQAGQRDATPLNSESLHSQPVDDDLTGDDVDDDDSADDVTETDETADGEATTDKPASDGSATPKKKSGWGAYNEQKARSKRRRRKDSR